MKTLAAVRICGCIIVAFLGASVDCSVVPYPGRPALLSYSPARGEFPVASLFGRGFFSYIDESGNSRIVSLEPNPLQGVRIDSEGRPLLELDFKEANKKESCAKDHLRKLDKLKPIKEFDERPFQDAVPEKDVKLPELDLAEEDPMEPNKNLLKITGQTEQLFVFPSNLPGFLGATGVPQTANLELQSTEKPPSQPSTVTPITEQPVLPLNLSYLPPKAIAEPVKVNPKVNLAYLPPKEIPGAVFVNPENPFLPQNPNFIPATPSTPSTTSMPAVLNQHSPSTASPAVTLPSTSTGTFRPPAAPTTTNAFPSFAPGNPFLPATTVFPNPLPPSTTIFPNPPLPTSTVFPNPPPSPTLKPPPKNPFLSPDKPLKPRPTAAKPTPQFNADKMNPFLSNIAPTTSQPSFSVPQLQSSTLGIPEQVKDTPEVEQAKHEHFLAHQMALAQLQLAQQQYGDGSVKPDETSFVSSSLSPCSHQPVTSGWANTVGTPELREDSFPSTDAASLLV